MRSAFYFKGKSSLEYGICVEKCPSFGAAQRVVEQIQIPGRNGALIVETGAYNNVLQSYEVWFKDRYLNATQAARELALWLLSGKGYFQLEDTYDPDIYRKAVFYGPLDVENWMLLRGRATLEFDCKPQRFFKSGDRPIKIQSGQTLYNSGMPALPLIQITGTGEGEIVIGGSTVEITDIPGSITIDSDVQNAYNGLSNLNNNIIVTGGFPVLDTGENVVAFSGGITGVEITPRWWTL